MHLYLKFAHSQPESSLPPLPTLLAIIYLALASLSLLILLLISLYTLFSPPNTDNALLQLFCYLTGDPALFHSVLHNYGTLGHFSLLKSTQKVEPPAPKTPLSQASPNQIAIYRPSLTLLVENTQTGNAQLARALLDTGSDYSFISPQLVRRLSLETQLTWPLTVSRFACTQPPGIAYQIADNFRLIGSETGIKSEICQILVDFEANPDSRCISIPSKETLELINRKFGAKLPENNPDSLGSSYDLLLGQDLLHRVILKQTDSKMKIRKLTRELGLWETPFGDCLMGRFSAAKVELLDEKAEEEEDVNQIAPESRVQNAESYVLTSFKPTFSLRKVVGSFIVLFPALFLLLHLVLYLLLLSLPLFILVRLLPHPQALPQAHAHHNAHPPPPKPHPLSSHSLLTYHLFFLIQTTQLYFTFIHPQFRPPTTHFPIDSLPYTFQPIVHLLAQNPSDKSKESTVGALLDSGAKYSYISSGLARELGLQIVSHGRRNATWLTLASRNDPKVCLKVLLWLHPSATFKKSPRLPRFLICQAKDAFGIELNASETSSPSNINLIFGSDLLTSILFPLSHPLTPNLSLNQTIFGWTLAGANGSLWKHQFNIQANGQLFNFTKHGPGFTQSFLLLFLAGLQFWLDSLPFYFLLF